MSGAGVAAALDGAIAEHGCPATITVDHGTEFTSRALDEWTYRQGVKLAFTTPGKPTEHVRIESFIGKLQDACLNTLQFVSIADAKERIEAWRRDYYRHRPPSSLGQLTPGEYLRKDRTPGPKRPPFFSF
jgi:putative transposase